MLILSRKVQEAILIGDDVVVKVVSVHGDRVCIGVSAPPHVPVNREEVAGLMRRRDGRVRSLARAG